MVHSCCPGYVTEPFATLVAEYPDQAVYPIADFRIEWGPVFHRGRLDGTARVLLIGQDPAAHEAISRRILVGEAGQRVQGLLAKIGITDSYVMVNTFLYSVFGQSGGERHAHDPAIAAYRNRWLDALLIGTNVTAVVALGRLAELAFVEWSKTQPATASGLHFAAIHHPTYPESAARAARRSLAETTASLLADWNEHLPGLAAAVSQDVSEDVSPDLSPDGPAKAAPYSNQWSDGDLVGIPERDLPAGCPPWWGDLHDWAQRTGKTTSERRATIKVVVPEPWQNWP